MTRDQILAVAKPILFNTEMVQALLEGRKHVTRRVVKQAVVDKFVLSEDNRLLGSFDACHPEWGVYPTVDDAPYQPYNLLYVRETWQAVYETEYEPTSPAGYVNIRNRILNFDAIPKVEAGISTEGLCRAMEPHMKYYVFKASNIEYADPAKTLIWRPSIHMPKEAARIFLRVTDVRVERLQDIDAAGIRNEGVASLAAHVGDMEIAKQEYAQLWNSTIPKKSLALYGWEANPWVWVIEFERVVAE